MGMGGVGWGRMVGVGWGRMVRRLLSSEEDGSASVFGAMMDYMHRRSHGMAWHGWCFERSRVV